MIRTYFEPLWTGEDPAGIERLARKLRTGAAGHIFTKAGLEMALWDLAGKRAGVPLYQLLGGRVRDFVPTKFSVSGVEPERAAGIAAWAAGEGFPAMKVKVGIDPVEDIARARAVRDAIGDGVRLGADANGGWDVRTAVRCAQDLGVFFLEQPVPAGDPAWLAEVRRSTSMPIVADESVNSPADAMALARASAADVFSTYVGKGGIGGALRVAAVAEAGGLCATVGSNLELGVGAAAMIHVATATPAIAAERFPCDILTPFYYEGDILREPLDITAGRARAPEGPGLGVELDEERVARFRVC
jgi:muconate cycloisomerase